MTALEAATLLFDVGGGFGDRPALAQLTDHRQLQPPGLDTGEGRGIPPYRGGTPASGLF